VARPRKELTDEQITHVEKLSAVLTQEQIADFLGVTDRLLRRRIVDDPRVSSAYKRGRANAVGVAGGKLLELVNKGNLGAICFYLKCQAGWRETDPKQVPLDEIPKLTDREMEREKRRMGLVR
jgi:hypothetical protein